MNIIKLKVSVLKTRLLYGDILKGVMEIIRLCKLLKFNINLKVLYNYLTDLSNIESFNDVDLVYEDLIKKLGIRNMLRGISIKSVIDNKTSNIIEECLKNYNISFNILEYIYCYFIKDFIAEFIQTKITKDGYMEVILDIPVSYIYNIYFNYESFSFDEKIDLFKEELAVWAMYNHIALLRKDDFEVVELEDEDILMVQFNISNR